MLSRRLTLTYVVTYLTVGGVGLLVFPRLARDLLLSNAEYEDVGFRLAGLMMVALAYLVWNIVRFEDWKYYSASIYLRAAIVAVLTVLFVDTEDPMFLVLVGIVLVGLVPSIYLHFWQDKRV
ncbi:MAG: hypothetical protein OER12_07135 [Acidimicrobiia bacterium]|nr:hypothetical protein [Acidimicrobiia bacterium]